MESSKLELGRNLGLSNVSAKKIYKEWPKVEQVALLQPKDLLRFFGVGKQRAREIILLAKEMLSEENSNEVKTKVRAKAKKEVEVEEALEVYEDEVENMSDEDLENEDYYDEEEEDLILFEGERSSDNGVQEEEEEDLDEYIIVEKVVDKFTIPRSRRKITPSVSRLSGQDICEINNLPPWDELPDAMKVRVKRAVKQHDELINSGEGVAGKKIITANDNTTYGVTDPKLMQQGRPHIRSKLEVSKR